MIFQKFYVAYFVDSMLCGLFGFDDIECCRTYILNITSPTLGMPLPNEHYEIIKITRLGREVVEKI